MQLLACYLKKLIKLCFGWRQHNQYLICYTTTGRILQKLLKIFYFWAIVHCEWYEHARKRRWQIYLPFFWGERPLLYKPTLTFLSCQPYPSRNHSHTTRLARAVCSNVRMCVSTSYCGYNTMKRKHSFDLYTQLYGERNVTFCIVPFYSFGKS